MSASAFSAAKLEQPPGDRGFIREHAGHRVDGGHRWGVEAICRVLTEHGLPIAPSMYYEHVNRQPCARERSETLPLNEIRRVRRENKVPVKMLLCIERVAANQ